MLAKGKWSITIRMAVGLTFTRLLFCGMFTKAGFCFHLCSIIKGTKKTCVLFDVVSYQTRVCPGESNSPLHVYCAFPSRAWESFHSLCVRPTGLALLLRLFLAFEVLSDYTLGISLILRRFVGFNDGLIVLMARGPILYLGSLWICVVAHIRLR